MNAIRTHSRHWRLEYDDANIAWLHIDKADGSTNVLSDEVLRELATILSDIEERSPAGLIIASDKANGFIAGADVESFTAIESGQQARELLDLGQAVFHKLAELKFPTVCLIHGFCLGGGLELALACRYQVALDAPETRIGLPEVRLGIHPGWGGSVRLIRRIGAVAAMNLMLSGRTVSARAAVKTGIIDYSLPERQLRNAALALIERRPPVRKAGWLKKLPGAGPLRPLLAHYLRRQVAKRARPDHYPAPYALIDIWAAHGGDETAMFRAEAESVASLVTSPTTRNLVRVFLLQERLKSAARSTDFQPAHVHVIGAGVMGGDIAAWCALQGLTVTVQDREAKLIAPAVKRARALFKKQIKIPHRIQAAMDRLIPDPKGLGVRKADLIIEAIVEKLDVKRDLFRDIEPLLRPDTLLATNTSSIVLEELAAALNDPQRLVGLHFFNPVAKMQLVEIIQGENTSDETTARAMSFCRTINRLPLPVRSSPGFLVNRILMPYLMEAVTLLQEGVPAPVIDRAARNFGMPMGPLELADSVGLDICHSVASILADSLNVPVPAELTKLVERGHLGRKSGRGIYEYKRGKPRRQKTGTEDYPMEEITDRLILIMLNEAVACLDDGIVEDADQLDAGMIFGSGFAPFRGGPMHYVETTGREQLAERLRDLSNRFGERFQPHAGWS